ncbi:MAG: acylphosphatase [Gemmatimonadales bacterium]|jgi:acylphosphatase
MIANDTLDNAPPEEARRGMLIRGRVQGVGFRWWTRELAGELSLRGTVRNLPDGSVEIHVAGPIARVQAFDERIRTGPRQARVVSVEEIPCRGGLPESFQIAL